ncbi:hypothetical protein GQ457_09G029340 [Hibiscus cannabinus]
MSADLEETIYCRSCLAKLKQFQVILQWSQVQIQAQNSSAIRFLQAQRLVPVPVLAQTGPVPPHMSSQGLPDGEFHPADRALVRLRLRRGLVLGRSNVSVVQPGFLMAGSVTSESLERSKLPVTCFALENPTATAVVVGAEDGMSVVFVVVSSL